jgi:hypothetical protein
MVVSVLLEGQPILRAFEEIDRRIACANQIGDPLDRNLEDAVEVEGRELFGERRQDLQFFVRRADSLGQLLNELGPLREPPVLIAKLLGLALKDGSAVSVGIGGRPQALNLSPEFILLGRPTDQRPNPLFALALPTCR